ncbi:hypothetical protein NEF87_002513 [Candidatus Lokiarchaeum ossiferum]|uniref:4Fe-4S ferredoxin-type domain-containing protein n=1 Tax=Candidatus Lokiarchaeum ossiferum TaxID=2951803 RepID=A0ABY6HRT6_9ARCH|nr:hypothetical protein NEF87_002513 [Candidatus Lokiarchaeum sp. B-35]
MIHNNLISIQKIHNEEVENAVFTALKAINAEELMVREGMIILIKPNVLSGKPAERAVTTHPEVLRAVIRWVKQFKPARVFVGDSSGSNSPNATQVALKACGILQVCIDENVECAPLEKTPRKIYSVKNGFVLDEIASTHLLEDADLIINIPKIKTHGLTTLTCCIKNMFGTVMLGNKAQMHARFPMVDAFTSALVDVYSVSSPQLTVIDGYLCQEGKGPAAGDVVKLDLILAGYDGVALDTTVCKIIDVDPNQVMYLPKAEQKNLGSMKLDDYTFVGEKIESVKRPFKLPSIKIPKFKIPKKITEYLGKILFKSRLKVDPSKCVLCGKCWQNCPVDALTPPEEKQVGKTVPLWDKKKCITCYCCTELCPHEAIDFHVNPTRNFLLSKLGISIIAFLVIIGVFLRIVLS